MSVILSGSIAYDYLMRFPGRFVEHIIAEDLHQVSLSFLVDEMTKHWGGVAANIAFTMAMLGAKPKLFGAVGRDFGHYCGELGLGRAATGLWGSPFDYGVQALLYAPQGMPDPNSLGYNEAGADAAGAAVGFSDGDMGLCSFSISW